MHPGFQLEVILWRKAPTAYCIEQKLIGLLNRTYIVMGSKLVTEQAKNIMASLFLKHLIYLRWPYVGQELLDGLATPSLVRHPLEFHISLSLSSSLSVRPTLGCDRRPNVPQLFFISFSRGFSKQNHCMSDVNLKSFSEKLYYHDLLFHVNTILVFIGQRERKQEYFQDFFYRITEYLQNCVSAQT